MSRNPLSLGRKARPTLKHRPAIWECMLGTVYAADAAGNVRYFDYDWDAAVAFAAVDASKDLRTYRAPRATSTRGGEGIRRGQLVLWVLR